MIYNAHFWKQYFQAEFIPQIIGIVNALEKRILPGFQNIAEESRQVSKDTWEAFMSMPGTGDEDPADFAEEAEQAGVSHYLLFSGIRQGMLNLFATAIYHAFEQQIMLFHRIEVLRTEEENNYALLKLSEFQRRLVNSGVDITTFSSWAKIDELRLLANTVKHADGNSSKRLHELRPDMFQNSHLDKFGFSDTRNPHIFQPLIGEDLYVSLTDVQEYSATLISFWQELSDEMLRALPAVGVDGHRTYNF